MLLLPSSSNFLFQHVSYFQKSRSVNEQNKGLFHSQIFSIDWIFVAETATVNEDAPLGTIDEQGLVRKMRKASNSFPLDSLGGIVYKFVAPRQVEIVEDNDEKVAQSRDEIIKEKRVKIRNTKCSVNFLREDPP